MTKNLLLIAALALTPLAAQAQDNAALDAEKARAKAKLEAETVEAQARLALEKARAADQNLAHTRWRAVTGAYAAAAAAAPATPVKKVTVAYVGVGSSEIPPALTYHLKLAPGSGLVVDWVAPGSPAEAAGVKQYDVLTQLDDQRLVNPEQLRTLVRLRKAGDAATFTLVRQGQPTTVGLKLGQTEVDETAAAGQAVDVFPHPPHAVAWEVMPIIPPPPGDAARAIDVLIDPQVPDLRRTVTTLVPRDPDHVAAVRKVYAANATAVGATPAAPRPRVLTSTQGTTLLLARFEAGKPTHLMAFDTSTGQTVFDGAVGTEAQRKAVPPAVAAQLETLEKNQSAAPEFGTIGR